MQRFGLIIILVGVITVVALLWFLVNQLGLVGKQKIPEETTEFPQIEETTSLGQQPISEVTYEEVITTLSNGEELTLVNILQGTEQLGESTFVLTGGLSEKDPPYTLTYYEKYDFWQLSLNEEPLGAVRRAGEEELQRKLGVDTDTMCLLNHSVMTAGYVNSQLGGVELGFSFCPGSVPLE